MNNQQPSNYWSPPAKAVFSSKQDDIVSISSSEASYPPMNRNQQFKTVHTDESTIKYVIASPSAAQRSTD